MPALTNTNSKILLTGANGFVAVWLLTKLLEKGYSVRATVRALAKGRYLEERFRSYGEKLEICVVGDIADDGAFDEAVKGIDAVIHTAAQVHLNADEPKDIIEPAVKGILGILQSVLKYGDSVQRVVLTSSCTTIMGAYEPSPVTVAEDHYLKWPVIECEEKGREASGGAKYSASKILSEKAAWDFYEQHKSDIKWDMTMINPPWVFGPPIHEISSFENLNFSILSWYNAIVKADFIGLSPLNTPGHGWVDVRDVADAHVLALETPAAAGERVIICAGSHVWQDWLDTATSLSPSPYPKPLPKGESGTKQRNVTFVTSKEKRIYGIKFKTMEETTRDMLEDFARRGW